MKLSTSPNLREAIFDVIAPYDCLECGTEGLLVCEHCWAHLFSEPPISAPSPGLGRCVVTTSYHGLAKALVHCMKVDAQRQACRLIARAMHQSAPRLSLAVCITSVPTAPARIRERGFDHGALIAREFARLRGLPYRPLLIRRGRAKQAGASRAQRAVQLKGAYQSNTKTAIKGQHILVIDDVTTTGATLVEVASVLKSAGAGQVDALVFAQTIQ